MLAQFSFNKYGGIYMFMCTRSRELNTCQLSLDHASIWAPFHFTTLINTP
ncbi:MAG: DUF645 family protein [Nitrososphaerota archaeon]|nr:DUF645 family protein [Nitrososphaerota archaeon]